MRYSHDNDRKSISVERYVLKCLKMKMNSLSDLVGCSRTFSEISDSEAIERVCKNLCESLADDVKHEEIKVKTCKNRLAKALANLLLQGKTVTVKMKTIDFDVKTRATTLDRHVSSAADLFQAAFNLLMCEQEQLLPDKLRLRLLGTYNYMVYIKQKFFIRVAYLYFLREQRFLFPIYIGRETN